MKTTQEKINDLLNFFTEYADLCTKYGVFLDNDEWNFFFNTRTEEFSPYLQALSEELEATVDYRTKNENS
jgi:hypothetical protein